MTEVAATIHAMIAQGPGGQLAPLETFEEAAAMARASGTELLEAEVLLHYSYALALRLRTAESLEIIERTKRRFAAAPGTIPARLAALAHTHAGITLGLVSRFEESRRAHAAALDEAQKANLEDLVFRSWINSGYANVQLGDTAAAMHAYHSALANCGPNHPLFGFGRVMLGELFLDIGDLEAAEAQINEAILTLATETVYLGNHRISLALARIWGKTDRREEARSLIESARSDLTETDTIGHALTWLAIADLALHDLDIDWLKECCAEVGAIASTTWFPAAAEVLLVEASLKRGDDAAVEARSQRLIPSHLPFLYRRRLLAAQRQLCIARGDWAAAYRYLDQERPQTGPGVNVTHRFSEELSKVIDLSSQHLELRGNVESTQTAAHDLRAPFTSSALLIDLLREQVGPNFSESFELLAKQVEVATSIVNRMTAAVAGSTSPGADDPSYDVVQVVTEAIHRAKPVLETKGQTIELTTSSDHPRTSLASLHLQRVVDNLVSNASKYSPPQSHITVVLADRNLLETDLIVIDHGLGFTPDDIEQAGGYQQTLSAQPTQGEVASGLGLFITKRILEAAGGALSIQSAGRNQGSTVTAHLPAWVGLGSDQSDELGRGDGGQSEDGGQPSYHPRRPPRVLPHPR